MGRNFNFFFALLFLIALTGCDSIPSIQLPNNLQLPDNLFGATPSPEISTTPVDTPTLAPTTTFQFPATWTPSWVKPATPTLIKKTPSPSTSQTPGSKTITPLYPTGLFSINGTTSQKTGLIPFKAGTITIVWKYSGNSGEKDALALAEKNHKDRLNTLYVDLTKTLATLNSNLTEATNANNSDQIKHWTDEIAKAKAQYSSSYDQENIRYQTQLGQITTTFSLKINRTSVNKPVTLVNVKGVYIGQVTYKTVSASDYYFTIAVSGPFQIDINR